MRRALISALLIVPLVAAADVVKKEDAGLRYSLPTSWLRVPAPSDMRAAQYQIPASGEAAAGELVVFFFGEGQGGSADANLERWYDQFTQPDGSASRDAAVITKRTVNGLRITQLDLSGSYAASPRMGATAGAKPGTRMLAAVIEGTGGPWFLRAVGPIETITGAKDAFDAMLLSLDTHR